MEPVGPLDLSVFSICCDGYNLQIVVPGTTDGQEMAEAWLAKWNHLLTPKFTQATVYQLKVSHLRHPKGEE